MLHKDNQTIHDLINENISQKDMERFSYEMDENWKKYSSVAVNHKNIEVRRLLKGNMTHSK